MMLRFNFDWICNDIEFELSLITDFFNSIYKNLPDMKIKAENEIDAFIDEISDDEERQALGSGLFAEHYSKYEEIYPNQINYQFIIMLHTFAERNIKKICDDYCDKQKLPFSIDGFEGDLGKKLKRYIQCFKPDAYIDADIQSIQELSIIRNNIVHNYGFLEKDEKKIRRFIDGKEKSGKSIRIENSIIIIERSFCDEYLIKIRNLFRNIFQKFNYRTDYSIKVLNTIEES